MCDYEIEYPDDVKEITLEQEKELQDILEDVKLSSE